MDKIEALRLIRFTLDAVKKDSSLKKAMEIYDKYIKKEA